MDIKKIRSNFSNQYSMMFHPTMKRENYLAVKNITFVVTEDCTLECSYCYQCNKKHTKKLSKEIAVDFIDSMFDERLSMFIDADCIILDFIGGEPLLEIELIDYIVDYFKYKATICNSKWKSHYMISMSTNGTLYFNDKVQQFIAKNKSRFSMGITIDGNKKLHDSCRVYPDGSGSYDVVEKAVKDAIKNNGMNSTKVTLAPENISYLFESMTHLMDLGLSNINANCVFEDVWDYNRDAPILYNQLIKLADYLIDNELYKTHRISLFDESIGQPIPDDDNKNWCGGTGNMIAIDYKGDLFPCLRYMQYSLHNDNLPELKIGNVKDGISYDNENLKCLSCITRTSQSEQKCIDCKVASGCAWCSGYNYDCFGSANKRAVFICGMHKARVLANYYYWSRVYTLQHSDKRYDLYLNEEDIKIIKGEV